MEDLYDNNEHTVFKLFFIRRFYKKRTYKLELVRFVDHLSSFHTEALRINNCKVYKNTGLLFSFELLVFMSFCDFNKLMQISKNIREDIIKNLEDINNSLDLDHFKSIINYRDKFNFNDEVTLIIYADFEKMNKALNNSKFNNKEIRKDFSLGKRRYSTKSTLNNNILDINSSLDNNNLNLTIEQKVLNLTEILRINKDIVGDISFIEQDLINIFLLGQFIITVLAKKECV